MQTRTYPEVPADFGHWLAGFIDGEGCFSITTNGKRRFQRQSLRCLFRIALRSDDKRMLEECRRVTGLGTVYDQAAGKGANWNPSAMWHVAHREDAMRLVEILEQHPLRSKKLRDFIVWAEAVRVRGTLAHQGRHSTEITTKLERLRGQLVEGRRWRAHDSALVPEPLDDDAVPTSGELTLL